MNRDQLKERAIEVFGQALVDWIESVPENTRFPAGEYILALTYALGETLGVYIVACEMDSTEIKPRRARETVDRILPLLRDVALMRIGVGLSTNDADETETVQ